jgi:hypothetical protein
MKLLNLILIFALLFAFINCGDDGEKNKGHHDDGEKNKWGYNDNSNKKGDDITKYKNGK